MCQKYKSNNDKNSSAG